MEDRLRRPLVRAIALLACLGSATAASALFARADTEHVVLADCRDGDGVFSSQMAYFPGPPGRKPQDVSVVATPAGQTALWVGRTTSSLFSTSGVTFTARLGPKVDEGAFAGTGDNGFASPFSCWQRFVLNLYEYGGVTCAQVYDCDHEPPPVNRTSTAPAPDPTAIISSSNSTSNSNAGSPAQSGLPTGTLAAIIAGVVALVAISLAIAGLIWVRRRSRGRPGGAAASGCLGGLFSRRGKPVEMGESKASSSWSIAPPPKKNEVESRPRMQFYELDGQWYGTEVHGSESRAELDAAQRAAELEARRKSGMTFSQAR